MYIRIYTKKVDKDPDKEDRNLVERGLLLDLAEYLDWATALSRRSRSQTGWLALTPLVSRFRTVATAQRSEIERWIQDQILLENCQQQTGR